jgi:hypothetical protein
MKKFIPTVLFLLLFSFGCAAPSTITFKPDGVIFASNYTIKEVVKNGAVVNRAYVPNIPDNWFTSAMKQVFESMGPFLDYFKVLQ